MRRRIIQPGYPRSRTAQAPGADLPIRRRMSAQNSGNLIRRAALAVVAALLTLAPAAHAAHAEVGLGDYVCTSYAGGSPAAAGSIQIVAPGAYTINNGSRGAYSHDEATNIVTFSTGDYSDFHGVYVREKGAIEIRDKADSTYYWTCNFQTGSDAKYAGAAQQPSTPAPTAGTAPAATTSPAGAVGISVRFPRGVKLLPSLSNGFVVGVVLDRTASLTGTVKVSATDARRYGLGRRAVVVGRASEPARTGQSGLEFKVAGKYRRKLRRARRLRLALTVVAREASGARTTRRTTITLSR